MESHTNPEGPESTLEDGLLEVELVMLSSPDGEYPWSPVLPEDVPAFIKNDPNAVAYLIDGNIAKKGNSLWYRAEKVH